MARATNARADSTPRSVAPGAPPTAAPKKSPYETLKEAILAGVLVPGQALVELALAEWCGVSRTPIREALLRLEQDGLVTRNGRELVVRERSQEEILDIHETRIILEAEVARVAASRRSVLDVANMRRIAMSLSGISADDRAARAAGNREFHRAMWRASHNEALIDLLSRLNLHLSRYPASTLDVPGRWEEANREHLGIVDAIDKQDARLASELAVQHFTRARDLRLQLWLESTF